MSEVLVHVIRGGLVESRHRGDLVVVDSGGRITYSVGDPRATTFWRSAAKPFQALPLVEEGGMERFGLTGRELALITSSHGGEREHTETVCGILEKIGLTEEALACGPAAPMNQAAARELLRRNQPFAAVHNACSGKHSGMLALCVLKGWPVTGYWRPDHPLQQKMLEVVTEMTGMAPAAIKTGIDGCGVPVFAMPVYNMALAFARLAGPGGVVPGARRRALRRICTAMVSNPFYVAGTDRLDTVLMEGTGWRLVAKLGAEAVYCVGLVGGEMGFCLKIEDGGYRALDPVVIEVLHSLGWLAEEEYALLESRRRPPVKNHRGEVVGRLEAVPALLARRFQG
ncbi:MAG: asparaginase [Peptococcaceae bacterium]|nr:asparaginase [Peptococcaceae bacterium]